MGFSDLAKWVTGKVLSSRVGDTCAHIKGRSIVGAFENGYTGIEGEIELESRAPVFLCASSDFQKLSAVNDDPVTIDGVAQEYRFVREEPDGEGGSRLILRI